ncbi:unnamed protein product [Prunus armeniaca]|uniref:Uncharacterized protein n=1 Tax=Prunus armeniaca TaxID=36596 RepID=A0A6J5Y955_PRUAR|nr:unnamed protein product [Prunus armeniaca]
MGRTTTISLASAMHKSDSNISCRSKNIYFGANDGKTTNTLEWQQSTMEVLGQLDNQVNDREKGIFPNQPEQNPRNQEHLKAIKTLRTGKTFDNRPNIEFEEEEAHIERGMQLCHPMPQP